MGGYIIFFFVWNNNLQKLTKGDWIDVKSKRQMKNESSNKLSFKQSLIPQCQDLALFIQYSANKWKYEQESVDNRKRRLISLLRAYLEVMCSKRYGKPPWLKKFPIQQKKNDTSNFPLLLSIRYQKCYCTTTKYLKAN